jgi:Flp pilus assembly protein TadG
MLSPLIRRSGKNGNRSARNDARSKERGVTIALVALSMVGMIGMAALSIDVGTLYQAKAEAQRAADAGALAAARLISISGVTGDPNTPATWQPTCGTTGTATLAAKAVAQTQWNFVSGVLANVTVGYGAGGSASDCSSLAGPGSAFSVNPTVTVTVQNPKVPTFFAHVFGLFNSNWSATSVSATASAEVYNPSGSGLLANGMVAVQPRCVKPWIIPNRDPGNLIAPNNFVSPTGAIGNPGVNEVNNGVIGESFNMNATCKAGMPNCAAGNMYDNPPKWNSPNFPQPNVLEYVPAWVQNASSAVPTCTGEGGWTGSDYQQAIVGCDQMTVYACGTLNGSYVDLTENPVSSLTTGDTATGVACLTNSLNGPDTLAAATYPFQITAGTGNPLSAQGVTGLITSSNSIVTIPIYDSGSGALLAPPQQQVTIIGFLQVFINYVDGNGNINVTVMNVSGCSNNAAGPGAPGSSPVPVRLITPP